MRQTTVKDLVKKISQQYKQTSQPTAQITQLIQPIKRKKQQPS